MRDGLGLATDGSGFKARPCQDRVIKARRTAPEVKDTHTHTHKLDLTKSFNRPCTEIKAFLVNSGISKGGAL